MNGVFSSASLVRVAVTAIWKVTIAPSMRNARGTLPRTIAGLSESTASIYVARAPPDSVVGPFTFGRDVLRSLSRSSSTIPFISSRLQTSSRPSLKSTDQTEPAS